MEGLQNLKDRICSFENLMGAYRDAAKGKRGRSEVQAFEARLGENLLRLQRELLDGTYRVGHYREFYVRYPKPRLVMALRFRDRVVQWAIFRQINPYIDKRYYEHSYGCRKGKGTLAAAETLLGWIRYVSRKPDADEWYLIKGDISKYFYRVDHGIIHSLYAEICGGDPWFIALIRTIIDDPGTPFGLPPGRKPEDCPPPERLFDVGMPIGNLTSQETANLYLDRLDRMVKQRLRVHFYVRYMDDFVLLVRGKENARSILAETERFLREELRLELSWKSRIQRAAEPVEFVGYLLTKHGMRLRKKTRQHIKRSAKRIEALYAAGKIPLEEALRSLTCYDGMCRHGNNHGLARWLREQIVLTRSTEDKRE